MNSNILDNKCLFSLKNIVDLTTHIHNWPLQPFSQDY